MYEIVETGGYSIEDFDNAKKIHLGTGSFYYVLKNGDPFLLVEVDTIYLFDTAALFFGYLCIGSGDRVYFIDPESLECREIAVNMYFGDFYLHDDLLLVLDGEGVTAFDNKLREVWRQPDLAVDGVLAERTEDDNILVLLCEMDPPGGWVTKRIDILTGKEI